MKLIFARLYRRFKWMFCGFVAVTAPAIASDWEVSEWHRYVIRAADIEQSVAALCSDARERPMVECFRTQAQLSRSAGDFLIDFASYLSSTAVVADFYGATAGPVPGRFLSQVLLLELTDQVRNNLLDRRHPMVTNVNLSNEFSIAVQGIEKHSQSLARRRAEFAGFIDRSFYLDESMIRPAILVEARKFLNLLRLLTLKTEAARSCQDIGYFDLTNGRSVYGLLGGTYFNSFKNAAPALSRELVSDVSKLCGSFDSTTDAQWMESTRLLRKFRNQLLDSVLK